MRKSFYLILITVLFSSHDLYVKMENYFLEPHQEVTISLYNGTFEKSENIISRERMLDASILSHGKRITIQPDQWKDQDSTITQLTFNTGEAGTYVVGVSTKAKNIELTAEEFNSYLQHDGVLDMLEQRTSNHSLDQNAVESYQKHVKAIYQVGNIKTKDWSTILGYPIEFVPLANPYDLHSGEKMEVQLLLDGQPLPNQLVYADLVKSTSTHTHDGHSHDHDHEHTNTSHSHQTQETQEKAPHSHTSGQQLRTDDQGVVVVDLPEDGTYYLRTIHMTEVTDRNELTHQSKWTTLTFEMSHGHDHHHSHDHSHSHDHDHDHQEGILTWIFVIASLLMIGLLFLIFRKNT